MQGRRQRTESTRSVCSVVKDIYTPINHMVSNIVETDLTENIADFNELDEASLQSDITQTHAVDLALCIASTTIPAWIVENCGQSNNHLVI